MIPFTYDFHIHSCLSPCGDDDMTPFNIAGMGSLIGLNAMALTDHNTCKNCESFLAATSSYGIIGIPGMELCTSEEVHVVCLFPTLQDAMSFDSYVEQHTIPIKNKPEYFGHQYLIDINDQISGQYPTLLLSASDISFDVLPALIQTYHGLIIPAHLDKHSNSLLSNLGFVPANSSFSAFEVADSSHVSDLRSKHPYLSSCHAICSSDAHRLDAIHEAVYHLHAKELSASGIIEALRSPLAATNPVGDGW